MEEGRKGRREKGREERRKEIVRKEERKNRPIQTRVSMIFLCPVCCWTQHGLKHKTRVQARCML